MDGVPPAPRTETRGQKKKEKNLAEEKAGGEKVPKEDKGEPGNLPEGERGCTKKTGSGHARRRAHERERVRHKRQRARGRRREKEREGRFEEHNEKGLRMKRVRKGTKKDKQEEK